VLRRNGALAMKRCCSSQTWGTACFLGLCGPRCDSELGHMRAARVIAVHEPRAKAGCSDHSFPSSLRNSSTACRSVGSSASSFQSPSIAPLCNARITGHAREVPLQLHSSSHGAQVRQSLQDAGGAGRPYPSSLVVPGCLWPRSLVKAARRRYSVSTAAHSRGNLTAASSARGVNNTQRCKHRLVSIILV